MLVLTQRKNARDPNLTPPSKKGGKQAKARA
jgi:hypothetical protein